MAASVVKRSLKLEAVLLSLVQGARGRDLHRIKGKHVVFKITQAPYSTEPLHSDLE